MGMEALRLISIDLEILDECLVPGGEPLKSKTTTLPAIVQISAWLSSNVEMLSGVGANRGERTNPIAMPSFIIE